MYRMNFREEIVSGLFLIFYLISNYRTVIDNDAELHKYRNIYLVNKGVPSLHALETLRHKRGVLDIDTSNRATKTPPTTTTTGPPPPPVNPDLIKTSSTETTPLNTSTATTTTITTQSSSSATTNTTGQLPGDISTVTQVTSTTSAGNVLGNRITNEACLLFVSIFVLTFFTGS